MTGYFDIERYLNIRNCYFPTFAPSGSRIAFLTEITGVPQVWSVEGSGSWPDQLTFFTERVSQVQFSPADDVLLFSMDLGGNERDQLYALSLSDGSISQLTDFPRAIHNFGDWAPRGDMIAFSSNRRNEAYFDLYVQDVKSREARMILEHDGTNHVVAWSPKNTLLFARFRTYYDNDLFILNPNTREIDHLTPHQGDAFYASACFSPDGQRLYFVTDENSEFYYLASFELGTGRREVLWTGEYDVEQCKLSPDGRLLAFTVNVEGYSSLFLTEAWNRRTTEFKDLPKGTISSPTWSNDSTRLAFALSANTDNHNIWVLTTLNNRFEKVTRGTLAGIRRSSFVEPDMIHYESFDGLKIPALFFVPPDLQPKNLPVIVEVHGGPESQRRPQFAPITQYFVNRGFAVLAPNVRGSSGYGKTYLHLDDVRKRMDSVKDLVYAAKWLEDGEYSDRSRIAVYGGSYGGFMVLAALTNYPDLWAAGVDLYGIANFETFFKNTGPWRRKLRAAEYGDPERDADFLRDISPIHKADRIKVPLMVIHGTNDPRVPIVEAEQIVQAVQSRGLKIRYLKFEDEGHGIVKLKNRIIAYRAIADFLEDILIRD